MPALLPTLLAGSTLLTGSYVLVALDQVPKLNYEPSCRAATATGLPGRNADSCKRDEETARTQLEKEWGTFTSDQRGHCVRLSTLGGSPSYVELLTCLEMAKDAAGLKNDLMGPGSQIER